MLPTTIDPAYIKAQLERAYMAMRDASDALTHARLACSKTDRTELADRIRAVNDAAYGLRKGNDNSVMQLIADCEVVSGY